MWTFLETGPCTREVEQSSQSVLLLWPCYNYVLWPCFIINGEFFSQINISKLIHIVHFIQNPANDIS